jgi:two-component system nitrogen regulation sensor histidine kinase NtrY
MEQQVGASAVGEEAVGIGGLPIGRPSKGVIAFVVGFVVAAALTIVASLMAVTSGGSPSGAIVWLLVASLFISAVLGFILAHRMARIARQQRSVATGARLHLRFVALFSLAAVVPAVLMAIFLGVVVSQGIEAWFSTRVQNAIDRAANVGRSYVDISTNNLKGEVLAMAADLNRASPALTRERTRYNEFLRTQTELRLLTSAYVVDRQGNVLARAEADGTRYTPPSETSFQSADMGDVAIKFDDASNMIRGLYRLRAYQGAYLFVRRELEPGMLSSLRSFEDAVVSYRDAKDARGTLQMLFMLAYVATALLVLLGSVWLGLSNATRIAEPIGRLAEGARRVAAGDLDARVSVGHADDEVAELGAAFNQMTSQLDGQRQQLVAARQEAEARSRFIEAVLGGVSAGVLSLDRDGRISAHNRFAANLLGMEGVSIQGRRIVDVAPEFAELLNNATPHGVTAPQRVDLVRENFTANLSVRMSPDSETGGFVLTFDDQTKLIDAQRQEAWKDVARRIAHEIKNPLTPIQLSAERLRRKFAGEIQNDREIFERCTETILRQVADIGRMVDEFSSFARMPTPRMAFADMSEIARSAVFAQRLVYPDVHFEAEGVDKPIGLICDERLIAQTLLNLLKNAAESIQGRRAKDGEPKDARVTLRLRDLDFGVQFEVIDNGLGFPAQNRNRLIEPYVTTRTKGSGLGLAIVARVVEDHGGAIVRFVLPKRWDAPADMQAEIGEGAL